MHHLELEPDDDETKRFLKGNKKNDYRDYDSPSAKNKGKKMLAIQNGDAGTRNRILCAMVFIALVGIAVHFHNSSGKTIKIDVNVKPRPDTVDFGEEGDADLIDGLDELEQKLEEEKQLADMEEMREEDQKEILEEDADLVAGLDQLEQKLEAEEKKQELEDMDADLLAIELPDDEEDNNREPKRTYSNMATMEPDPLRMHPKHTDSYKEETIEKYGKWHFWDGDEDERPMYEDYCAKYPNRDIPEDDFPDDAWQGDAVFVNHLLNDADELISRAQEAIFAEYGNGKPLASAEAYSTRRKMFHWDKLESLEGMDEPPENFGKRGTRGTGGWTTQRSFDGLVRRLLHAMMTRDTFTIVLAGHSAAAGHGNHFRQSYMMQMHSVLSPIFSRLGVKLTTRNMAQGGLGTVHSALGSSSIFGNEVDLLLWDSEMTEKSLFHQIDLFMRQGLIGGNRVPVIWGNNFRVLKFLHDNADADIGEFGTGMDGIKETTSPAQAETLPYSMRYVKCSDEAQDLCKDDDTKYCSTCWIDRDDGIYPEHKQYDKPHGRVSWHPGWRQHLLQGRVLTFAVLDALQAAVQVFSERTMGGPPLEEELWHVTEHYENIRSKVKNLLNEGDCKGIEELNHLPKRLCTTPMKAFTQYTPRANFEQTALTSIIKPTSDGYVPHNKKTALYEGPDAHNTCFDLPDNEPTAVDVWFVASARRRRQLHQQHQPQPQQQRFHNSTATTTTTTMQQQPAPQLERRNEETIVPGNGWQVIMEPQGVCDGTYNAICARSTDHPCVLYGHHDERGSVVGSELSGWLVMTVPRITEGLVLIKLHTWHYESENPRTDGWTTVNNERQRQRQRRGLRHHENSNTTTTAFSPSSGGIGEPRGRELQRSVDTPELCDAFGFDYAIDGKITSLNREEFLEKKQDLQRVVEVLTLLDDPNYTSGEARDVEVAVRLRGCGRKIVFGVSHIYYA